MSEKLKGFGYEALSEMTEEQWKETVSLWMKEEPNIAISVDLNNDETLMKYEEDGEAGWVYTATSKVGEKQTLQVVCVIKCIQRTYTSATTIMLRMCVTLNTTVQSSRLVMLQRI